MEITPIKGSDKYSSKDKELVANDKTFYFNNSRSLQKDPNVQFKDILLFDEEDEDQVCNIAQPQTANSYTDNYTNTHSDSQNWSYKEVPLDYNY